MTIKFEPGDVVIIPEQGSFEIASVHLDGVRPIIKYTDRTHSSIRTITQNIEDGSVKLQKKAEARKRCDICITYTDDTRRVHVQNIDYAYVCWRCAQAIEKEFREPAPDLELV